MAIEVELAGRIRHLLDSFKHPALAPYLAEWPRLDRWRTIAPVQLPVLRWFPQLSGAAAVFDIDLVTELQHAAASLAWRQTYPPNEINAGFLNNYGWCEIFGGSGPLMSEHTACGLLILGPSTHYPLHRHDAEEVYLPLSGTAAWRQGDAVWRDRCPGTLIFHASVEPHAMRTAEAPLLALYLWRGANLMQTARLETLETLP